MQQETMTVDPNAPAFDPTVDPFQKEDFGAAPERPTEAFDPQAIADEPLADFAAANAPAATDDSYVRYAMSGLLPIPLYRQHGNNSYGDFNKKDAQGRNLINFNYFPPFQLIAFFGGSFPIPYENLPDESDEPTRPAQFEYSEFIKPRKGFDRVTRTAKQCADIFMSECRRSGGYVFDSVTGYHINDSDRGLGAVRELFDLVLPVREIEVFGVELNGENAMPVRIKNGIPFKGPFLADLLKFVTDNGAARVVNMPGLSKSDRDTGLKLALEIRNVLQLGVQMATTILNETEAEMRDPKGEKKAYDPPNLEVDDAPVSTDSYCLAHLNRTEIDDKQLEASKNIGAGLSEPMVEAVHGMTALVREMREQGGKTVPAGKNVMPLAEVEKLLDQQRKDIMAEMDQRFAASASAGNSTAGDGAQKRDPGKDGTSPAVEKGKGDKTK